jgi:hypothetical protein
MVQFRRLDPLANASPWQRHMKRAVKTFTLTEEQYQRVAERRPQLIVSEGDAVVLGRPYRDFLEIHYAFPEVLDFRTQFKDMFRRCTEASSRDEAPRGALIAFRDRPNRPLAEQLFWESALEEGRHWVETDYTAVPEQEEPSNELEGGYKLREATADDRNAIADIEAEATGLPRLRDSAIDGIYENQRWLYMVDGASGKPAGWVGMRREPGGWGIIDEVFFLPVERDKLLPPLMRWCLAFLRNNCGRRQRRRVYLDDKEDLALMRSLGYMPAESGVDYTRPVEAADIKQKVDERQSHGTIIKFGDWR